MNYTLRATSLFRFCLCALLLCWLMPLGQLQAKTGNTPNRNSIHPAAKTVPLLFMENRGQVADKAGKPRPDILFAAHSNAANIYLTATGIYYQFTNIIYPDGYDAEEEWKHPGSQKQVEMQTSRFSLELAGANPHPAVQRQEKSSYTENYYLPQCPDGITGIAGYSRLVYKEVYPHIDWVVYSNGSGLKYDFIVRQGGNPGDIKLRIKDANKISITQAGELLLQTRLGEVREKAPVSFSSGQRVKTAFRRNNDGTIGFTVAMPVNGELRIDPVVVWATYNGGSNIDQGISCTADAAGNYYMCGATASTGGIATTGAFQAAFAGTGAIYDGFITKFDAAGNRLWGTYYGGTGLEYLFSCVADAGGNLYATGQTASAGLATAGSFQPVLSTGGSGFLMKFNTSGVRLWCTYYNGAGRQCALDPSGNVYMAGTTGATSGIATANGFQTVIVPNTNNVYSDAFLVKFDASGNRLWGTYYGGAGDEGGNSCATDALGNVYLTGTTTSTTNIYFNGYQNTPGNTFLVKFDASGNRLWGTYYNTSVAYDCATDADNNIYISGNTGSVAGIASPGAFQAAYGGGQYDGFVAKFDASGNRIWATYFGNSGVETGREMAINSSKQVFITGGTTSSAGMVSGGFQQVYGGGTDGYVAKFDSAGNGLWSSYFGGGGSDIINGIVADQSGSVIMTGTTLSATGIATTGAFQTLLGGSQDAFLLKIADVNIKTDTTTGTAFCSGTAVNVPFTVSGTVAAGNVFTAQLSNAAGSFASPVTIGTLTGTTSGTIAAVIPVGTPTGTGYRIRVVSSAPAAVGSDNGVNLTITASVVPVVTISQSPSGAVCAGTSVTFTATPVNGGTLPSYQWVKNNNTAVGANATTYTDNGLSNNDALYVVMTSNAPCAIPASDTSNVIAVAVNPVVAASVSVTASTTGAICAGTSVTFTATPANGGATPGYQWKKNGVNVGTNSNTYTDNGLTNNDVLTVVLASSIACTVPVTSNAITMMVNPVVNPAVTITANPGSVICAGTAITFTANPVNGNTVPTYQWQKNGNNVGTNSAVYTDNSLANNDVISVVMTSNAPCATAATATATLTITVNPVVAPSVTIAANAGDTICTGTGVTYTATPVNGGATPGYQWYLNGVAVPGANSSTYYNSTLATGNTISVVLTGNAVCATTNTASSNVITMTVFSILQPTVSIIANPSNGDTSCQGKVIIFTAVAVNGGANPIFQWKKNGVNVGSNTATYMDSTLNNNDCISLVMHGSLPCTPVNNAITSNTICYHIKKCCDAPADISVLSYNANGVVFSWTGVAGALGYEFTATTSGANPPSGTFTTGTTATISSLITSNTYYLYVRTKCANGAYSQWTKIPLLALGVGATSPDDDFSIYLYPNPVTDASEVVVKNAKGKMEMGITDIAGRVIYKITSGLEKTRLDLHSLPSGMYMLRYSDGLHTGYIKMNKQ